MQEKPKALAFFRRLLRAAPDAEQKFAQDAPPEAKRLLRGAAPHRAVELGEPLLLQALDGVENGPLYGGVACGLEPVIGGLQLEGRSARRRNRRGPSGKYI